MSEYTAKLEDGTVVLVEVVRCKNCKWFSHAMHNCARFRHGDGVYSKVEPDDFCAWGERKQ